MSDRPSAQMPATLEGFKREAKRLKKEKGMVHSHALEVVAKSYGFRSFVAARRHYLDQ